MILNGISVVVFCYNSEKRIEETLKHIALQKFTRKIEWELIVIDNNSTDGTVSVTDKIWKTFGCDIPFKIISEKKQ